jgi:glutamate---cysteine ligase / carboxylate-amine ligase
MFPRVGIPCAFSSYADYVEAIDVILRSEALPEPTFLWWDVRLQPRFGTVELRVMDAQSTVGRVAALASFVQCIAHLELEQGFQTETIMGTPEVLDENRFLAARDGMSARLIDPDRERRVPASEQLAELILAARPHAQQLGSEVMLEGVTEMAQDSGADRQRRVASERGLGAVIEDLAEAFMT